LNDAGLLERSAGGDREAFERVVQRHSASVYRLARVLVPDDEAEDVLQQTFLAAWTHAGRFRAEASVRTWLLTIARHAALRLRQRRAHEPLVAVSLDDLGVQAGWGATDPETLAIASERQGLLESAFASLTPEEREVITLRDLEGLSGEDTAAVLGLTVAAMKSRLHRARLALAARVRNEVSSATRRT
jgi:RNA polymerase sigma-70 factor (ECF subfamily)